MAKTNVTYANKSFGVNTKNKEVNCTLTCEINLDKVPCIEFLENKERYAKLITDLVYKKHMKLYDFTESGVQTEHGVLTFTTTGKAKCSEMDEFNEVIGKRIALTRAQSKAFIVARDIYYDFSRIVSVDMIELYDMVQNCADSHDKCNMHVKENF